MYKFIEYTYDECMNWIAMSEVSSSFRFVSNSLCLRFWSGPRYTSPLRCHYRHLEGEATDKTHHRISHLQ